MTYASPASVVKFGAPSFIVNGLSAGASVVSQADGDAAAYDVKLSPTARTSAKIVLQCFVQRGWSAGTSKILKKKPAAASALAASFVASAAEAAMSRVISANIEFEIAAGHATDVRLVRADNGGSVVGSDDINVDPDESVFIPACDVRLFDAAGKPAVPPPGTEFAMRVSIFDAADAPDALLLDESSGAAAAVVLLPLAAVGGSGGGGLRMAVLRFAPAPRSVARPGQRRVELVLQQTGGEVRT